MAFQSLLRVLCILGETWSYARRASRPGAKVDLLKVSWAREMLRLLRVETATTGQPFSGHPAVFVGNHLSYIDVLLLMREVPGVCFVAKNELRSWPLFGPASRAAGTVFVDRACLSSRMRVRKQLESALLAGRRLVIFPSGTTTLHEEAEWKKGAFHLAANTGTPLQAFRISYSPLRKAAFLGDDGLLTHLFRACAGSPIRATLEFAEPVMIAEAAPACAHWRAWTAGALLAQSPGKREESSESA